MTNSDKIALANASRRAARIERETRFRDGERAAIEEDIKSRWSRSDAELRSIGLTPANIKRYHETRAELEARLRELSDR